MSERPPELQREGPAGTAINNPALVRVQYACEENLQARQSLYAKPEGPDARQVAFAAIAEGNPRRLLEVGGGQGELAQRLVRELGVELAFLDQSERMVELARARGLDAAVGDAQHLTFPSGAFDCAVAAWMLYHVPDLPRALAELARVLRPGGRLVAVTNGAQHLQELRALAGRESAAARPFSRENGQALLLRHFATVERRDVDGWLTVSNDEEIWRYLHSASATRPPTELPPHELPFRVRTASTVFIATTPAVSAV